MTRLGCAGIAVLLCSWAAPAAGQAPQAWLVRQGNVTRFVAAPPNTPPTDVAGPGWTLSRSGEVTSYPNAEDQNHEGVKVLADSSGRQFPGVVFGPRNELWLLGDSGEGREWADFLDAAESFYRHGSKNTERVKAQGPAVIGRFGPTCRVMSLPASDLLQVQRVQLSGTQGQGAGSGSVSVGRFMRWLVNPRGGTCTPAEHDTLFLFGLANAPNGLAQPDSAGFFLVVPNVKRSSGIPKNVNEAWSSVIKDTVATDPPPDGFSLSVPKPDADATVQLCSFAEANPGCQWERRLRRRTYVLDPAPPWPGDDPATWDPFKALLNQPCSTLGTSACGDGAGWGPHAGAYLRTDYRGVLPLARAPSVTSTLDVDTVVWAVPHAGLDSAASNGRKVPLGIMSQKIGFEPLPRKSIPPVIVAVIVVVVLLVAGLAWYVVRDRDRVRSAAELRSMLRKALGIGRDAEEGARTLHAMVISDRYDVVAFGWELVHPRIFSARDSRWRRLAGRFSRWLPGSARRPQPLPSTRRKHASELMNMAGIGGRPFVVQLNRFSSDPGLAVCAGLSLPRSSGNNLAELLFEVDPAWARDRHLAGLVAMRGDPAALFCLGYEIERCTGPTERAEADAWVVMLPEPHTSTLWNTVLNAVARQERSDPLGWVRLGFALATQGGSSDQFERRIQEMVAQAERPRNGGGARSNSTPAAELDRYDQVLLGMWLARPSRRRWYSPDTALAGVLLRLRGTSYPAESETDGVAIPILRDDHDVRTILLWLGHQLAALAPGEPSGAEPPPPPIDEEKPISEDQIQPELVQDEQNRDEQNEDGPSQDEQNQDGPSQDEQKLFIQLPEALLAQLSSGVQQALVTDGGGPEWAARLASALREAMRDEARAAVKIDTETRVAASTTALETRKNVEDAVLTVLSELESLRAQLADDVGEIRVLTEQKVSELKVLAERTIELARWVQAQARQTEATRTEAEAGFAQAVEAHAARAAELWREEANAIVAPVVQEQVATQWEPYREREQRLDPFIRDVRVMDRVQGFLDTLKQDEGFIDRVLALREKVSTETWLVLTDHASPYLRIGAEQSVQEQVEPEYRKLGDEIRGLSSRDTVRSTLEAGSTLGYWIDALWEGLQSIDGIDGAPSVRERLRDRPTPLGEWSDSFRTAIEFATHHANVYRRLLDYAFGGPRRAIGEPRYLELAVLKASGLAGNSAAFPARLREYLEPSARAGCLGEVIRAVQYLVEAFPREQLQPHELARFRETMQRWLERAGLPGDFHDLAGQVARGIGLEYRPVRYYQASIDAPGYEFIGREVTRISLTQRLGFDAQPSSDTLVVRVRRPFFFENETYYAGHAHVARP
jgi:hypothetical protein